MSHQINWNRQLGLALGLFLLGTAAYWLEFKHKPEKEASEEQSKRVFQLKDHPVQSIQLTHGNHSISLNCLDYSAKLCKPSDHSKWEITAPLKIKADDTNVNTLLSTLSSLSSTETIDLKEETPEKRAQLLKEYGLDPASRKSSQQIHIVEPSGETILYLGGTHPVGENIFAIEEQGKKDAHQVYLIPHYFKSNLDHDLTYWRDKKLLTLAPHEIESFELHAPKSKLSAHKKQAQWELEANQESFSGDLENINSLLTSATFLTAKSFASDRKNDTTAKSTLKGFSPVLTLTLQKEKEAEKAAPSAIVLTLFQKKGGPSPKKIYATVSNLDPLFELDANVLDKLDKSLKDLRLVKLMTSMERFSAKKMEFSGNPIGEKPLHFTSSEGKWKNSENPSAFSGDSLQAILDQLSGNRIQEFLKGTAIPPGQSDGLKITVGDDLIEIQHQWIFWKANGKLYARDLKSNRNEVFLMDSTLEASLPWTKDFFKKAEPKPGPSHSSQP